MGLLLKRLDKKFHKYWLCIYPLLFCFCSCSKSYKGLMGSGFLNNDNGIRFLLSDDLTTSEIDGFSFDKETIKTQIWEKDFHIDKDDICLTPTMRLGKQHIFTNANSVSYEQYRYVKKIDSRRYFHIRLKEVDMDSEDSICLQRPSKIILNIYFNDSCFDHLEYLNTNDLHFYIVVTDFKCASILGMYPNLWSDNDYVDVEFNVYMSNTFVFDSTNNFAEWDNNHWHYSGKSFFSTPYYRTDKEMTIWK